MVGGKVVDLLGGWGAYAREMQRRGRVFSYMSNEVIDVATSLALIIANVLKASPHSLVLRHCLVVAAAIYTWAKILFAIRSIISTLCSSKIFGHFKKHLCSCQLDLHLRIPSHLSIYLTLIRLAKMHLPLYPAAIIHGPALGCTRCTEI